MRYHGFKKVHEDNDKAILKHKNGSELKIAKGALSGKHLDELRKLPLYQAEGTYIEEEPQNVTPQQSPVNIFVGGQSGSVPAPSPAPQAMAPQAPPQPQPGPTLAPQAPAPQPQEPARDVAAQKKPKLAAAPQPQSAPMPMPQQPQRLPQEQEQKAMQLQKYVAEDQAWTNDLNNGHIQPKTYQDLFNSYSTTGKIGTLFGLMLGGAGSGLTKTPNVVMQMMQQEIDNDLQAQLKSKDNARSFIKLNQEHLINQAQIPKMLAEGKLTAEQAKLVNVQAQQQAYALSKMQMNRAAFHQLVANAQKLPAGSPERTKAENALALMFQGINNENFDIADRAASAGSLFGMASGNSSGQEGFKSSNTALRMSGNAPLAEDREAKNVPGFGDASRNVPENVRQELTNKEVYDKAAREYIEFARKHSTNWANLNPVERRKISNQGAALAAELQGKYRDRTNGGVWKPGEQDFIETVVPSKPDKWSASFNAIPKLEQTLKNNEAETQSLAKQVGIQFKGFGKGQKKEEGGGGKTSGTPEGTKGIQKSTGKPIVFKGGKWVYP
jgi:hypothetical protein